MQSMKNMVSVNLEDFPDFQEVLSHKNVGEECTFTVTADLTEVGEKTATLKINSVKPEGGYSEEPEPKGGETEGESEDPSQSPALVVMGVGKKKKANG